MLRLHREDTYTLPADAQPSDVVRSEEARRTLWMMGCTSALCSPSAFRHVILLTRRATVLRNLFAGNYSPVPFALNELTALLPAEEQDAAFGIVPSVRAALPYSQAAVDNPALGAADFRARSLFGTVIQAYQLWGRVARGACLEMERPGGVAKKRPIANAAARLAPPWTPTLWNSDSSYAQQVAVLTDWERGLSRSHAWSEWNLRIYLTQDLDVAFASIFVAVRLCNIVLRCSYLTEIRASMLGGGSDNSGPNVDSDADSDQARAFWTTMSTELFSNVLALHEGITLLLASRPSSRGFPPLLPFALYSCGSLATQLSRCPALCPALVHRAPAILERAKADLLAICTTWPIAAHWHSTLETASALLPSSPAATSSQRDTETQTPDVTLTQPSSDALRTPTPWSPSTPVVVDAALGSRATVVVPPSMTNAASATTNVVATTSPASLHSLCLPFESARYPGTIMLGHEPTFAPEDGASASWVF